MKYHIAFLGALFAVLGAFAYFIFSFNEDGFLLSQENNRDVINVLNSFRQSHEPQLELNLSALYGDRGKMQVLHPLLDLQKLKISSARLLCNRDPEQKPSFLAGEAVCQSTDAALSGEDASAAVNRKNDLLRKFLYEKAGLPRSFLSTPPFVDREGNSYAYLLVKKASSPYNEKAWIERNLSYFRIPELRELVTAYGISSPAYSLVAELKSSEVEMAVRGEPLVLTAKYLLLRDQSRYGFSPLSYWVYDLNSFENALKNGDYELVSVTAGRHCFQKMGNACWTYSTNYALSYLYRYSMSILAVLGFVFLTFLGFYIKHLVDKGREQRKHRLSLQVLSHEFRTPVSSLLLMMDPLREKSQKLDVSEQDLLTRMSAEIYRLQRIVEVSRTYLQAEGGCIQFNKIELPSINHWITDFIAESNLNIEFQPLEVDQAFEADPFWLKFILSNLVQNAFAHGVEPVQICVLNTKGRMKVTVLDHGDCEFPSLSKMVEAFTKSQKSKGMGLGLNIVKYIVDEWGGEMKFSKSPTSFTLFFDKSKWKGVL